VNSGEFHFIPSDFAETVPNPLSQDNIRGAPQHTRSVKKKTGCNKGRVKILYKNRQKDYQSLKPQFKCLKVNICLSCQQNPG